MAFAEMLPEIGSAQEASTGETLVIERPQRLPEVVLQYLDSHPQIDIEHFTSEKVGRLSRGIRIHIRRLKQEGRVEEAHRRREEALEAKRRFSHNLRLEDAARDELHMTMRDILTTEDPIQEAVLGIKATFLLYASGEIDLEQRRSGVAELLDLNGDRFEDKILDGWASIREDVERFIPSQN